MLRQEKEAFVSNVKEELLSSEIVIVVNRGSITVDEITKLRKDMSKSKSTFKVIKKLLLLIPFTTYVLVLEFL